MGLFDDINIACDSLIDDYEEEVLKDGQLQKAAEVLDKYLSEKNDRLILEIKQMVMLAAEYGTCIGFDF